MRPEGHVASRRAVKDETAAPRTPGTAILDGSISGPPYPAAARTRLEDPTDRTWTHTSHRSLDGEVRMLLSFQRPPRPLDEGDAFAGNAPAGAFPARDRPVSIALTRGRLHEPARGALPPVRPTKIQRRATGRRARCPGPDLPASAHPQAAEPAAPDLQDRAVEPFGREVYVVAAQRLTVELHGALGQEPARLRAGVPEAVGDHAGEVHRGRPIAVHREVLDRLGRLLAHDGAVEVRLRPAGRILPPEPRHDRPGQRALGLHR